MKVPNLITMAMVMYENRALFQLLSWMSPSYPVGAFTFSQGLENAVETGLINDLTDTTKWISNLIRYGNGHADLVFLAMAWEAADDKEQLSELIEFAEAYQPTSEVRLETSAQGAAFLKITREAWPCDQFSQFDMLDHSQHLYPVVVGVAAKGHAIGKHSAMLAFGHAYIANLVSAAVRLVPLGQTDGQCIIAEQEPLLADTVQSAMSSTLGQLSNSTVMADITSMRHETQYTRLFRS
ncbi:MAG: urease accessory protein UreF [Pseudomonadales bacterium]|nr:urease accessory protein UreF [Pseudomonadales bacterium]